MKFTVVLALIGAVALSGCAKNGGIFGRKDIDAAATSNAQTGLNGIGLEGVEQTSIAFFNSSVGDRVLFPVDRHTLTPESAAILDGQAQWLLANTGYQATIEGHADEQGTREYNLALSSRRASSVYNYLASKGVPEARMTVVPYGKERPLAICSDETCWAQNRRSVTVVAGGFSS